ncbi:hypothetical protein DMENIID0001_122650 [Sergentomyia squamirostris]
MSGINNYLVNGEDLLLSQSAVDHTSEKIEIEELSEASGQNDQYSGLVSGKYTVKTIQNGELETQVWICDVCLKEFKFQYEFFRHYGTHAKAKRFDCSVCKKTFQQHSTLQQHMVTHSAERSYVCDICTKSFNRISSLISHRKIHSAEKAFKCPVCYHGFHQKGNLRNHMFTHTNERPYKCPYCDRGFNQMSNLSCHKRKAHASEMGVTFNCRICHQEFNKNSALKAHMKQEHVKITDENGKPGNRQSREPRLISSTGVSSIFSLEKSIIIPLVDTNAMRKIRGIGEIPFGLLETKSHTSVLVRIFDCGDKSIIREASGDDLKSAGKILIAAIIKENEDGSGHSVKTPDVFYEMIINNGSICFKEQQQFSQKTENEANGHPSFFGGNSGNNAFSNLMEVIKNEEILPVVPNMMKFFADVDQSAERSHWEKIVQENEENKENIPIF